MTACILTHQWVWKHWAWKNEHGGAVDLWWWEGSDVLFPGYWGA